MFGFSIRQQADQHTESHGRFQDSGSPGSEANPREDSRIDECSESVFHSHSLPPLKPYYEVFVPRDSHWGHLTQQSAMWGPDHPVEEISGVALFPSLLELESGFVLLRIWCDGQGLRASFRDIRAAGA